MVSSVRVLKRGLHESDGRLAYWMSQSASERLAAVEVIRQTATESYGLEQAFPRVFRVIKKAQR